MPIVVFFFLFSFHSDAMERDINLSSPPNGWLEQKRHRESHTPAAHGGIQTLLYWGMQHQHKLRDSLGPEKRKGKDLGVKWFASSQSRPVSDKYPMFLRPLQPPICSQTQQASSLEVLEAEASSLAQLILFVCLFTKLIKRNHGFVAKA